MAFELLFTDEAAQVLADMENKAQHAKKLKKVRKCLALLEHDPSHPGLHTHKYESLTGPAGEEVWEVYVENRTPSAWRVWFWYGPGRRRITVLTIGPHP